jgi:hypothetical protein
MHGSMLWLEWFHFSVLLLARHRTGATLGDTGQCLFFLWQPIWVRLYMHGKWQKGWILQMQEHGFGRHLRSGSFHCVFCWREPRVKIWALTNVLLYCMNHCKTPLFPLVGSSSAQALRC